MYVYSRRDDMTLAVELKLKKWTRVRIPDETGR